jgi:hypothetical protein
LLSSLFLLLLLQDQVPSANKTTRPIKLPNTAPAIVPGEALFVAAEIPEGEEEASAVPAERLIEDVTVEEWRWVLVVESSPVLSEDNGGVETGAAGPAEELSVGDVGTVVVDALVEVSVDVLVDLEGGIQYC